MNNQRVTITAQLRDHLTGPVQQGEKALTDLGKAAETAGKKTEQANKSFEHTRNAAGKIVTGLSEADVAAGKYYDTLGRLQQANKGFVKGGQKAAWASDQQALAAAKATKETNKQTQAAEKSVPAMSRMERAMRQAEGTSNRMQMAFRSGWDEAETGPKKMVRALDAAGTQMVAESKEIASKIATNIEGALNSFDRSGLQGALGGLGVGAGVMGSLDRDRVTRNIAAAEGVDPEAVKGLVTPAFEEGFGADYATLAANAGTVVGTLELEPGSPEAAALLKGNAAMEDAWGITSDQLSMGVRIIADTDDKSFTDSQKMLANVLRRAPQASRDELVEGLREYAPQIEGTGFSTAFMLDAMAMAAPSGPMAVDKTGDLFKEFNNLMIEPAKEKAYGELGLDQQDIANRMLAGDQTAFQDVAAAVAAVEDDADQRRLAVEVWGTPIEDLGLGNVDELAEGWSKINTQIDLADGTLEDMIATTKDGAAHDWDTAWRQLTLAFIKVGDAAAPLISILADIISFLATPIAWFSTLLAGAGAIKFVAGPVKWLFGLFGGGTKVLGFLSKAFTVLGRVILTHPILWIPLAIYTVIKGLQWLYENVDWVRDAFDGLGDGIRGVFGFFDDLDDKIDNLIDKVPALRKALDFGSGETAADDRSWAGRVQDAGAALGESLGLPDLDLNSDPESRAEKAERYRERGFIGGGGGEENASVPGFYSGGYTGDILPTNVAGVVHGREFVFDHAATAAIGVPALEQARAAGRFPSPSVMVAPAQAQAPTVVQGDTVEIKIYDARDPEGVARQVEAALARRDQSRALTYATPAARGAY